MINHPYATIEPETTAVPICEAEGTVEAGVKLYFNSLIATAKRTKTPVLALIEHRDRWLLLTADARTGPPSYYICDTHRRYDPDEYRMNLDICRDALWLASSGQINISNTMHMEFPMARHTPNASEPLAYWMRRRMLVRMNVEPTRSIDDLLRDCYKEWRIVTVNREDLQKELVNDLRDELMQRWRQEIAERKRNSA